MKRPRTGAPAPRRWLVLLPQLAKSQGTLRVRLWRRLQELGAIPLKAGAFVLPDGPERLEDLEWIVRELREHGADATLLRSEFLGARDDAALERAFVDARDAEYAALVGTQRRLARARRAAPPAALDAMRRRLAAVRARDYFPAASRSSLASAIEGAAPAVPREPATGTLPPRGSTWVTRAGVGVDRMASAWLVRRFVDPRARFRFVASRHHAPSPGEVRFDMLEAEFTHARGGCTFETVMAAAGLRDAALARIAAIVHELDLRDGRYAAPEAPGVRAALDGIAAATVDDGERIAAASRLFDALYASFGGRVRRKAQPAARRGSIRSQRLP